MRQKQSIFSLFLLSPSSRRAWIEIDEPDGHDNRTGVALLAEGVDRNLQNNRAQAVRTASPSSRRAWIEMTRKPAK